MSLTLSKLSRMLGLGFDIHPYNQNIFLNIFLICHTTKNTQERILLTGMILLLTIIITIFKNSLKTPRPCSVDLKKEWCPGSYDIPSGHTATAVFWLPFYMNRQDKLSKIIYYYLLLQPLSRIIGNVHSVYAVLFGLVIGTITYNLYKYLSTTIINKK
jgi:membrane-associated phospholipid phosphatase